MKLQITPRFPALVTGVNGDEVTKANGTYTFGPDYGSLTSVIPTSGQDYTVRLWHSADDTYKSAKVSDLVSLNFDHDVFWTTDPVTTPNAVRIADRVFMGAAVANDGKYYPDSCPDCIQFTFTNYDWLGQLYTANYGGGGYGIVSGGNVSQVYILADSHAPAPSPSTAGASVGIIGMTVGAQSEGLGSGNQGTVIALAPIVVNDALSGNTPAWALYLEAHRVGDGSTATGTTYGIELNVRNSVGPSVGSWTPYQNPTSGGLTVGLQLSAGAGYPDPSLSPCSLALFIGNNPAQWQTGILFGAGGLAANGPGSTITAIGLPHDYQIQWYTDTPTNTLAATIAAAQNGILFQSSILGFTWTLGSGGPTMMSLDSSNGLIVPNFLTSKKDATYSTGAEAQFVIAGNSNPNIRLQVGMDTTTEFGFLQATHLGGAFKNIVLNPGGGNVGIGGGALADTKFNVYNNATYSNGSEAQVYIAGLSDPNKRLMLGMDTTVGFGFIQATRQFDSFKNLFLNPGGGNVGIGNTSATHTLEVTGTAAISTSLTSPLVNSNQIAFPATQVPSADANTLDDYEEGTWVPSLSSWTVVGATTLTGTYTKVGNRVYWECDLVAATSLTVSNGVGSVTGLPFTPGKTSSFSAATSTMSSTFDCGLVTTAGAIFPPAIGPTADHIYLSGCYRV